METEIEIINETIFSDVSYYTIRAALEKVHQQNPNSVGLANAAFELALKELLHKEHCEVKEVGG